MDDNQNEWGDEETLDTKKFRVSYLQDFLAVLQAVTRLAVAQRGRALGKQQNRFPFRARSVLLTSSKSCFPNLLGWQTHLCGLQDFLLQLSSPLVCFLCVSRGAHPLLSSLSSRSRRCCLIQTIRRTTGSGPSSTWMPPTSAYPPWHLLHRRVKSMRTAWTST